MTARLRTMLAKVPGEFQEGHELDEKTVKEGAEGYGRPGAHAQRGDETFEEIGKLR
jgi:hypothetical protein